MSSGVGNDTHQKTSQSGPTSFWCVCARGKQNPACDAFEIEKGNGDVRDCNIRTAAAVVSDTSTRCTYSSLEPLVPGAVYLVHVTVHASTQQTTNQRYEGLSRAQKLCEQGLPHCTYVLQAEQRLPHATEEKAKRNFPMERGPTAKHHPAWNPQCTQWFRAEEIPLLCPTPKVMSRFSLGDVGEARWPLSHRWIDTSPILPDTGHDSRNQGRVVLLSMLSILSACVRICQLREGILCLTLRMDHSPILTSYDTYTGASSNICCQASHEPATPNNQNGVRLRQGDP